jgi:hypothetical protein
MYPPVWGPPFWDTIHLIAYIYPENPTIERQNSMTALLLNLSPNLPCHDCGTHSTVYMKEFPPAVESRDMLKKWAVDFHNEVNKRTGKTSLTYEEADDALTRKFFIREDWMEIKRGQDMRREDHKMIDKYKALVEKYEMDNKNIQTNNELLKESSNKNGTDVSAKNNNNTIIITVSLILFLILIAFMIIKSKKTKK